MKLRPASSSLLLITLSVLLVSFALICSADTHDAVLLESIPTLTFYNGQYTAGRRTAPIPQVRCVGGTAQSAPYQPKVVQCRNMGSDGRDIQWRCEADMDSAYRFGAIRVSCEGYNHPDDPYILRGSCGFEYELDYTEEGRQRQNQGNQGTFTGAGYYNANHYDDGYSMTGSIFSFLILGFIVYVLYSMCSGGARQAYGGGGGGGYGGGPDFGPGYGGGGPYGGGGCGPTYVQPPIYQPGAGGGGFWSGMATGGLLGYLWNRPRTGYSYGYGAPSMFGGGGYSRPYAGTTTFGGGGGGVSSSGGSRTAAGFGGTTRR